MTLDSQLSQARLRKVFNGIYSLANPDIPDPKSPVPGHAADDISQRRHIQYSGQRYTFETSLIGGKSMALIEYGGEVYVMITKGSDGDYSIGDSRFPPNTNLNDGMRDIRKILITIRRDKTKEV